jgi:hypothetical protein
VRKPTRFACGGTTEDEQGDIAVYLHGAAHCEAGRLRKIEIGSNLVPCCGWITTGAVPGDSERRKARRSLVMASERRKRGGEDGRTTDWSLVGDRHAAAAGQQ